MITLIVLGTLFGITVFCGASLIFIKVCSASRMVNHEMSINDVPFVKPLLPYPNDCRKV